MSQNQTKIVYLFSCHEACNIAHMDPLGNKWDKAFNAIKDIGMM